MVWRRRLASETPGSEGEQIIFFGMKIKKSLQVNNTSKIEREVKMISVLFNLCLCLLLRMIETKVDFTIRIKRDENSGLKHRQ